MPNLRPLFIVNFVLFFFLSTQFVDAQSNAQQLKSADSLFTANKYKEALTIYEELLLENAAYSPAMLLKMGFISEGIGEFGKASMYLSKYYEFNPNPRVINKIKTLTNQNSLVGYEVSDKERFLKVLVDLKMEITGLFAFLMVLFLILMFLVPNKRSVFFIPAAVCLLLAFAANNFLRNPNTAIITGGTVLIMDQPTSAGNLVRRVNAGHRVTIEASNDMWYQIKWGNQKAFIKKNDLSKI